MKIIIVGDGGVGSNLGPPLVKMITYLHKTEGYDFDKICIVDGDKVEEHNLLRQGFIMEDCGKFKSEITASFLQGIAHQIGYKIPIESCAYYFKEDTNLIKDGDIVLVGVDNFRTRKIIEDKANELDNCCIIYGGNEFDDGDVNVFIRENGENKTSPYSKEHPEILEEDKLPDEMTCEEASQSNPQLILANLYVANIMLEALYSYLTGNFTWREKQFDIKQGAFWTIKE